MVLPYLNKAEDFIHEDRPEHAFVLQLNLVNLHRNVLKAGHVQAPGQSAHLIGHPSGPGSLIASEAAVLTHSTCQLEAWAAIL